MPVGFARAIQIYFDFRAFLGLGSPSSGERIFSLPSFSFLPLLDFAGLVRGGGVDVEDAGALMFLSKRGRWGPGCCSNKGPLEWNNGTCLIILDPSYTYRIMWFSITGKVSTHWLVRFCAVFGLPLIYTYTPVGLCFGLALHKPVPSRSNKNLASADIIVERDIILSDLSKQGHQILLLCLERPEGKKQVAGPDTIWSAECAGGENLLYNSGSLTLTERCP